VWRLAARDSSIDLMSLDQVFVPEFASAGFLHPLGGATARYTEGVVSPAVASATWQGKLVAIPFWANTQLLWFRKSVAARAGIDVSRPFTWDQIIEAARRTGTTVSVQAGRYEGFAVWINALIAGAGGEIINNPQARVTDLRLGLDTPAAKEAARIIRAVAESGVGGPGLANATEEETRAQFQGGNGGFLVNWPYVWRAAQLAVKGGSLPPGFLDDMGWARYPQAMPGRPSAPPFGGIVLALGAFSKNLDLAQEAATCITSPENQKAYMLDSGNPAARTAVYADAEVLAAFPMAPLIAASLEAAVPRPLTPYYQDVSAALQNTFHPPAAVVPGETGKRAQELILGVLNKEVLL
jgi:multiple sugar transport system substrate-binding protein